MKGQKHNVRTRTIQFDTATLRRQLGLSQTAFWGKLGLGQSGGSRSEDEGHVSVPIMKLIRLQYIEGIDVDKSSNYAGIVESERWLKDRKEK